MLLYYLTICFTLTIIYDLANYITVFKKIGREKPVNSPYFILYASLRMFIPFISLTIIFVSIHDLDALYEFIVSQIRLNTYTLLVYLLTPIPVYVATILFIIVGSLFRVIDRVRLKNAIGETTIKNISLLLILVFATGLTVNAIFGFGEEIGWRSYMFIELYRVYGFYYAVLLSGIIWGLWHVPLYIVVDPKSVELGFDSTWFLTVYYVIFCTLLSIPLSHLLLLTNSIGPSSGLHGSINALWRLTHNIVVREDNIVYRTKYLLTLTISWFIPILLIELIINIWSV
ncbi:MAG: hypothetical protein B6U89_07420 [Desulfurococcales archaeon ex4484_58]|nr:MAG: hypothetical protein B6U89_07420 [Desulfurococcales archaeon ex4484_58]